MATKKKAKTQKQSTTQSVVEMSEESKKILTENARVVSEEVPKLLESENYQEIARTGARHSAFYLEEELKRGVSEEDATFMPEAHIYKDGKLIFLAALDARSQEDIDKYISAIFKGGPTMVLLVSGIWISAMARQNGGRPSQQPDRVNAGVGTVYLASDNIVAQVGRPVFSTKTPVAATA